MTNQGRLQKALRRINRERAALLGKADGLSRQQLEFQPSRSSWSIGQVLHHVGLVEQVQHGYMKELLEKGGKSRQATRRVGLDELPLGIQFIPDSVLRFPLVLAPVSIMTNWTPQFIQAIMFSVPLVKTKAAPRLYPDNGIPYRELLKFLEEVRASTLKILVQVKDWDLSKFSWRHPLIGERNIYGALELLAGHDQRHGIQIDSIKKHRDFPKT